MLYLVTNRKLTSSEEAFYDKINKAVEAKVDAIILREKDLEYDELLKMALKIKEIIGERRTKLIINSNIKVAKKVKAYGIQLSYKDFINLLLNDNTEFKGIIGVSVHSEEEAKTAEEKGANYIIVGHIFETDCKKGVPPRGLEIIKNIKSRCQICTIAIGGITLDNAKKVIKAGADGIAVMSSIMLSDDAGLLVRNLLQE